MLLSKINLLRGSDQVQVYNQSDALNILRRSTPEMIVIYADIYTTRSFDLISDLRLMPTYANIPILLVCERIEQEFILSAFDEGISDYITLDSSEPEFLMRILWCLQKSTLVKKCADNTEQLINLDVIHKDTYFYQEEFVDKIFGASVKNFIEQRKVASFLIVTPDIDSKYKLSGALLGTILKKTLRSTDIVGVKDENKFYILLPNTKIEHVQGLHERLQDELTKEYTVSIGAAAVDETDFKQIEKSAKIALQDALKQGNELITYKSETAKSTGWLDSSDMSAPHKNFKLFKQSFTKKLNNVIAPIFYQIQKAYEENLFQTKINQVSSEGKSIFSLKSDMVESTLTITYPGFSKINIDMNHRHEAGEENNRITLNLSELDESKLTAILEKFIKEYRNLTNVQ